MPLGQHIKLFVALAVGGLGRVEVEEDAVAASEVDEGHVGAGEIRQEEVRSLNLRKTSMRIEMKSRIGGGEKRRESQRSGGHFLEEDYCECERRED